MLVRCETCSMLVLVKDFLAHYKYIHNNVNQAVMKCAVETCDRSFSHPNSARKHANSHPAYPGFESQMSVDRGSSGSVSVADTNICHNNECYSQPIDNNGRDICDIPMVNVENSKNIELLHQKALVFTSNFYADPSFSRVQVQRIIKSFQDFLNSNEVSCLRDSIINVVPIDQKEFAQQQFEKLQTVFHDLNSEYKRLVQFEKNGSYIPPVPVFIGTLEINRRNGTMTTKDIYCQYIPIKDNLKLFMETPETYTRIMKYCTNLQRDDNIENIVQSKLWKQKHNHDKTVFPLILYQDDFETGNPLGSRAGIHKLNGTYLSIGCLPPEYRSRLVNIFLVQLCHASDYKKIDGAVIYKQLIDDLNDLAETGIELSINGAIIVVYFKLALITGDNLGLNSTLGFTESFSANYSCRFCKTSKGKSRLLCSEIGCVMRNESNYYLDLSRNNLSQTGIKKKCIWNRVVDFHAVKNYSVDIMHDLLEGVCKIETALLLKYLIGEKKFFSLENLNNRIKYFQYPVSSNPPPLISETELNDRNIRMTASEMKTFTLNAGLLFGDLIAKNDKHWELHILLRKILCICLQSRVTCHTANSLEKLVEKHHRLYVTLYGETLKPKHHNMLHYARIVREIGPLRHIWSMRYEANHRPLKQSSAVSFNRINICKTLAVKNQLHFNNAILHRQFFKDNITFEIRTEISTEVDGKEFPLDLGLERYIELIKLSVNNSKFRRNDVILIRAGEKPLFGRIDKIFLLKDIASPVLLDFAFLVNTFQTVYLNEHLQAYRVVETDNEEIATFNPTDFTEKLSVVLASDENSYIACDEITSCV